MNRVDIVLGNFLNKDWMKNNINLVLLKLRKYDAVDRCPISGRQCIVRRGENNIIEFLMLIVF